MATNKSATLPKARKVLNIRNPWYNGHKSFFDLPRELRDMIYEHNLIEPPLWYRRHRDSCPLRDPLSSEERPMHLSTLNEYQRKVDIWFPNSLPDPDWYLQGDEFQDCRRLCQARGGLGLLRSNKQIYQEANSIFWGKNMFCFDHIDDFVAAVESMPESAHLSFRHLSLLCSNTRDTSSTGFEASKARMWEALLTLKNLKSLELAPEYTHHPGLDKLLLLKCLQEAHILRFMAIGGWRNNIRSRAYLCSKIRIPFDEKCMLPRSFRRCNGKPCCAYCGIRIRLWSVENRLRMFRDHDGEVSDALESADLVYAGASPQEFTFEVGVGGQRTVQLIGLPIHDVRTRRKLRWEQRRAEFRAMRSGCSNARKVRTQDAVARDYEDWMENELPDRSTQTRRSNPRKITESPDRPTKLQVLEQRELKRSLARQEERARERMVDREVKESLVRAFEAMTVRKSAARKRVNR